MMNNLYDHLAILFYKITFCSIKLHFADNIIDSFKSNDIVTNYSTTFLQTVELANSY